MDCECLFGRPAPGIEDDRFWLEQIKFCPSVLATQFSAGLTWIETELAVVDVESVCTGWRDDSV